MSLTMKSACFVTATIREIAHDWVHANVKADHSALVELVQSVFRKIEVIVRSSSDITVGFRKAQVYLMEQGIKEQATLLKPQYM